MERAAMPNSWPSIDRRYFLAGILAAGTGLLSPRRLLAKSPATDPDCFVLLSDVHVSEDRDKGMNGWKSAEQLERVVAEILAMPCRPACAIVAGDCAYWQGKAGDYAMLGKLMEPLQQGGMTVHFTLGNHDCRDQFLAAFPDAAVHAAVAPSKLNKFVSVLETPHANWFLLDSLDKTHSDGKDSSGLLGEAQLAWLVQALDARTDKPALLVAHHGEAGLRDNEVFFRAIAPRKQVKAYFYGHTHQWSLAQRQGIHLLNLPSVLCGHNHEQSYGFVTARLRPDGATLTTLFYMLGCRHPAYGATIDLPWRQ